MSEQLRLIPGVEPPPWYIDDHTREIGRRGLEAARRALRESPSRQQPAAGEPSAA